MPEHLVSALELASGEAYHTSDRSLHRKEQIARTFFQNAAARDFDFLSSNVDLPNCFAWLTPTRVEIPLVGCLTVVSRLFVTPLQLRQ
jgi:hypothetical protein